jgi:protein SCO1/2
MTTKRLLPNNKYLVPSQLVLALCFAAFSFNSYSDAGQEHHSKLQDTNHANTNNVHEHYNHEAKSEGVVQVSRVTYSLPDVYLTSMSNTRTGFVSLVNEEPVILNFIFTTCTAVCPMLTATFSQVQEQLVSANLSVPLISISIDPEQDTPARLKEYAQKFGADPNWQFFTGDKASIIALQKAFGAYRGNKMNHVPQTFIKTKTREWIRIDGFASAMDIISEYVKASGK